DFPTDGSKRNFPIPVLFRARCQPFMLNDLDVEELCDNHGYRNEENDENCPQSFLRLQIGIFTQSPTPFVFLSTYERAGTAIHHPPIISSTSSSSSPSSPCSIIVC